MRNLLKFLYKNFNFKDLNKQYGLFPSRLTTLSSQVRLLKYYFCIRSFLKIGKAL